MNKHQYTIEYAFSISKSCSDQQGQAELDYWYDYYQLEKAEVALSDSEDITYFCTTIPLTKAEGLLHPHPDVRKEAANDN